MAMPVLTGLAQMQTEVLMEIMQHQEEMVAGQVLIAIITIVVEMYEEAHQVRAVRMMIIMHVHVEMATMKVEVVALIQIHQAGTIIAVHQQVQALVVRLIAGQVEVEVHNQEALLLIVGQEVLLLLILHHQAHQAVQVAVEEEAEVAVGQDNLSFKIR